MCYEHHLVRDFGYNCLSSSNFANCAANSMGVCTEKEKENEQNPRHPAHRINNGPAVGSKSAPIASVPGAGMQPVLKIMAHDCHPARRPTNIKRWGLLEEAEVSELPAFRGSTLRRETTAFTDATAAAAEDITEDDLIDCVNVRAVKLPIRGVRQEAQVCVWLGLKTAQRLEPGAGELPADQRPSNVSPIRHVWWVKRGAWAIRSDDLVFAARMFALTPSCRDFGCVSTLASIAAAEFDMKVEWAKHELQQRSSSNKVGLTVKRGEMLESIKTQLKAPAIQNMSMTELFSYKWMYQIKDETEFVQDAGGVAREVMTQTFDEIFSPERGMFAPTEDGDTYMIAMDDGKVKCDLEDYNTVGLMLGKALMDGMLVPRRLAGALRKRLLGARVKFQDLQSTDHQMYESFKHLLNDDGADNLCLVFEKEWTPGNPENTVPLKPGGADIEVTDENKLEYLELLCTTTLAARDEAVHALRKGIFTVVPESVLSVFNYNELEILLNGKTTIDAADWKANTVYKNYTSESPQVQWFFALVERMTEVDKCHLLQFATGSAHLPVEGFKGLESGRAVGRKFQLTRIEGETRLPQAHTCFNTIELPPYLSPEDLEQKLRLAMMDSGEGFFMEEDL